MSKLNSCAGMLPNAIGRLLCLLGTVAVSASWLVSNHYPPWTSFYNDFVMAVALTLIVAGLTCIQPKSGMPLVAFVVLWIATIPWVQWSLGLLSFSGDAWVVTLYLFGLAAAISAGYIAAELGSISAAAALSAATLTGGVLSAFLAIGQATQVNPIGIWGLDSIAGMQPYANLAQPNNLATLIGLGSVGLWLLRERDYVRKPLAAAILAILLVGAAVTQSRTQLLFGPFILLCVSGLFRRTPIRFKTSAGAITIAVACQWLLVWLTPAIQRSLLLDGPPTVVDRGVHSLRFQVWPVLWDSVMQAPWKGYGWLQVGSAQLAVAERHAPLGKLFLQSHNLFLDLILWCGLPLGLLLSSLLIYWLVSRLRTVNTTEAVAGVLVVGLFLTHAMLELPHHYAYFLIPVGLWVGLIEQSIGSAACGSSWRAAQVLSICSIAVLVAVAKDYREVEENFRLVRFENSGIGRELSQPRLLPPHAPYLSGLTSFMEASRTPVVRGISPVQLDAVRLAVYRYPYEPALLRLASLLALNGNCVESRKTLTKLRHIYGELEYQAVERALRAQLPAGESELTCLESLDRGRVRSTFGTE